jgi:hypothetical protein
VGETWQTGLLHRPRHVSLPVPQCFRSPHLPSSCLRHPRPLPRPFISLRGPPQFPPSSQSIIPPGRRPRTHLPSLPRPRPRDLHRPRPRSSCISTASDREPSTRPAPPPWMATDPPLPHGRRPHGMLLCRRGRPVGRRLRPRPYPPDHTITPAANSGCPPGRPLTNPSSQPPLLRLCRRPLSLSRHTPFQPL